MKISGMANNIKPSLTRQLFNMAQNYTDVIDLTLGDPDVNTSDDMKYAACDAILNNKTKYSSNAGLLDVRQAVSQRVCSEWKMDCTMENVIVTVGGMEALYLSLLSIIDPGDEVIIFAPYYVNYYQMIKMCGGVPVIVDAYGADGFVIDEKCLREKITSKTVALIVNSPNNPTGGIIDKKYLEIIYNLAEENDLYVISDEVYRTLTFDGIKHESILSFDKSQRVILIDSLSKEYSMTGYRAGFAYACEDVIKAMTKLQENVAACASLPSQYAMLYAYENNIKLDYIKDEFEKRRNFLYEKLSVLSSNISVIKPQATFYMFVNIEKTGLKSEEFALKLLESEHVAVVPGKSYGENYDGYIRVAFTKNIETLEEACIRLCRFLNANEV